MGIDSAGHIMRPGLVMDDCLGYLSGPHAKVKINPGKSSNTIGFNITYQVFLEKNREGERTGRVARTTIQHGIRHSKLWVCVDTRPCNNFK